MPTCCLAWSLTEARHLNSTYAPTAPVRFHNVVLPDAEQLDKRTKDPRTGLLPPPLLRLVAVGDSVAFPNHVSWEPCTFTRCALSCGNGTFVYRAVFYPAAAGGARSRKAAKSAAKQNHGGTVKSCPPTPKALVSRSAS